MSTATIEAVAGTTTPATPSPSDAKLDAMMGPPATPDVVAPWDKKDPGTPTTEREPDLEGDADPKGSDDPAKPGVKQPKEPADKAKAPRTKDQRSKVYEAKQRLAKDNWEQPDIDALTPEQLFARADKIAKRQDADTQAYKELKELRGRLAKDSPSRTPGRSGVPVDDEADTGGSTPKDGIDEMLTELRELGAEDTADKVAKRLRDIEKVTRRDYESALKAEQEVARKAAHAAFETRLNTTRSRLAEEFPGIEDEARFESWLATMARYDPDHAIAQGGDETWSEFARDMAWIEFGAETEQRTRDRLLEGNRKTRSGQMDTPTNPSGGQALTIDQWENLHLKAVEDAHGDPGELARLRAMIPIRPSK